MPLTVYSIDGSQSLVSLPGTTAGTFDAKKSAALVSADLYQVIGFRSLNPIDQGVSSINFLDYMETSDVVVPFSPNPGITVGVVTNHFWAPRKYILKIVFRKTGTGSCTVTMLRTTCETPNAAPGVPDSCNIYDPVPIYVPPSISATIRQSWIFEDCSRFEGIQFNFLNRVGNYSIDYWGEIRFLSGAN